MNTRTLEFRTAISSLLGAGLWSALSVLAGLRRAPLGAIELLALFAVLVVVPLGINLASMVSSVFDEGVGRAAFLLQPIAAIAAAASFWPGPGIIAAALAVPWFLLGALVALACVLSFARRQDRSLTRVAVTLGAIDLALAGGWLVMSRAGQHPMGFQEPIVLLTAVHFHYIGFAVALIAASALRVVETRAVRMTFFRPVVWLTLLLPFVLAAGFVISPVLRLAAALGLALTVPALAGYLFWFARSFHVRVARIYLRLGVAAAWVAMGLAGVYAITDYAGKPFLTIPGIATTHGVLNGLGFVLLGMLAWSIEVHEQKSQQYSSAEEVPEAAPTRRKRPSAVTIPEFVAREFYDR
jgi:hypothetical protein